MGKCFDLAGNVFSLGLSWVSKCSPLIPTPCKQLLKTITMRKRIKKSNMILVPIKLQLRLTLVPQKI